MKNIVNLIGSTTIILFGFFQPLQADLNKDIEEILDNAEQVYPKYFPSTQKTQSLEQWQYRHYPSINTYLGINKIDKGVYVAGEFFGNETIYINSKEDVKIMLKELKHSFGYYCDSAPENVMCEQNGYDINFSTDGQCIVIEENNHQKIETGINVLFKMADPQFELKGINSNLPEFNRLLDSLIQKLINELSSSCRIHAQGTNIPENLSKYIINTNVCSDITSSFDEDLGSNPGIELDPSITFSIAGKITETFVPDCFATDANTIDNEVTKESWVNKDGVFVKEE